MFFSLAKKNNISCNLFIVSTPIVIGKKNIYCPCGKICKVELAAYKTNLYKGEAKNEITQMQ
jgi:hypothetical protein